MKGQQFRLKKGNYYLIDLVLGNCPVLGKRNAKRFTKERAEQLVKENPDYIMVKD